MDKPDDKPKASGPLKPPHPPPKKPGSLPKGPVPPRGGMQMPGMTPIQQPGKPPMMGGSKPPAPGMPPAAAKPPMAPPNLARPAMPPPTAAAPSSLPPAPTAAAPIIPPAASGASLPPAINSKLKEADAARGDMEGRIAELEKKLMEEKEKVLLASLRSKEEEAVSAKVETSIKEIQDKLRREKREQELDENRRKAESRALELERRMAEEREAWVSTLKTQLSQRDQATQEMEGHFSTRLKDLEYRWAQEKTTLENAIRDKDAEMARLRHEMQLKSEQEKSFWEDRIKSVSGERDKLERELERAKDRLVQERDQMTLERQALRDQQMRSENALKLAEDQHRGEKGVLLREHEAALSLVRQQAIIEKDAFDRQVNTQTSQLQSQLRELAEKTSKIAALEQELSTLRAAMVQKEALVVEFRQRANQIGGLTEAERKQFEVEIKDLSSQLSHVRSAHHEEVQRVQSEADARMKTLQARLDWYDSNVRREYEVAREKVQHEVNEMEAKVKAAEKTILDLKLAEDLKAKEVLDAEQQWEEAEKARISIQQELEQVRHDWKQAQWEVETQLKEANESVRSLQRKLEEAEELRIGLEQELNQRTMNVEFEQKQLEQRQTEIQKLTQQIEAIKKDREMDQSKVRSMESQVASYKSMLDGQGLQDVTELSRELKKTQDTLQQLKLHTLELEKKEDLSHDRERELKQTIAEKESQMTDLKNKALSTDRKFELLREEYDQFRTEIKKQIDQRMADMNALKKRHDDEMAALKNAHEQELQSTKRSTADEVSARIQAELPPPGPSAQMIESQVRQDLEGEYMQRLRDKDEELERRLAESRDETKKEMDRLKWDVENSKEELKRAREARLHIEREAQELLQQAEEHYQSELQKKLLETEKTTTTKPKGLFATIGLSLGRFLDTPLIDTKKKKDDAAPSQFKE